MTIHVAWPFLGRSTRLAKTEILQPTKLPKRPRPMFHIAGLMENLLMSASLGEFWRIGNGQNILENSETDGLLKAVLQRLCLFGTRFVKRASTDQETDGNLVLVLLQNIKTLHLLFIHVAIATHFP